jgi:predicted transcriptional regulator
MEQGWVKLYRKIELNDFLMYDNTAFIVFTKLLLFADKNKGYYRAATRTLAERVNLPHSTTYKALKRLEAEGLIHIEKHKLFSKFHITNWTVYQSNREIDTILEHNASHLGKQQKKQQLQIENSVRETGGETQGKRRRNADETYNKKEELRIKKNLDKSKLDKAVVYGKPEINELFNYWKDQVGFEISAKRQANRNATNNLLKKYGLDKTKQLIDGVVLAHDDRYAPRISDFCELQSKLNQLLVWGKGRTQDNATPRF